MISVTTGAETPVDVITLSRHVNRPIPFVRVTETATTNRLTATVVIRDHIVTPIYRIGTGANPTDRGNFGSRWA